jgi:hypothetical protein
MKIVTKKLYVPIRISTITKGFEKENFVYDTNKIIEDRGAFILTDGEILNHKIGIQDVIEYHLEAEWDLKAEELVRAGLIDGVIKPEENQTLELEKIEWSDDQKTYFGIENPYQVSEELNDFSYDWALIDTHKPYLEASERILALLHGQKDNRAFTCSRYHDEVVYTNKRRLVCMSCGALHCVLKQPLNKHFKQSLTEQEWFDYVDDDGTKREEEMDIDILDFLEIENIPKIWTTFYWKEAVTEFVFFTRATEEELEDHYKHSGSIEDLIQAGWSEIPTPPFLAFQLAETNLDIDKLSNALGSLNEGILSYKKAKTEIDFIKHGVLQLFHTIELILKAKLEELGSNALKNKSDNPTVIKLLQKHKVLFSVDELQTIKELRQLRNSFQHAEAKFNYRSALKLMRNSIIFIDRFCVQELKIWIAEHISESVWQSILSIADIQNNAVKISNEIIESVKVRDDCEISLCLRCETNTVVSRLNKPGTCVYCRHIPTLNEIESVEN